MVYAGMLEGVYAFAIQSESLWCSFSLIRCLYNISKSNICASGFDVIR